MTSIKYLISNLEQVISVDVCKAEERVDQDSWDIEGLNKFQQLDWGVKTMGRNGQLQLKKAMTHN